MKNLEDWQMRQAWQIARQARTCPPAAILRSRPVPPELAEHLKRCPFCTEELECGAAETGLERIARAYGDARQADCPGPRVQPKDRNTKISSLIALPASAPAPRPGEVRSVAPRRAGWGPGARYFNPPLVLVLATLPDFPAAVTVAQVYDDVALRAGGDLDLDPDDPDLFAETWNTYTLGKQDLAAVRFRVDDAVLARIRAAAADPETVEEPWDTPVAAFRRLEIEVGAFFAMAAVSELMAERERGVFGQLEERFSQWPSLRTELHRRHPRWQLPPQAATIVEGLLRSETPPEEMARAAAEVERIERLNVVRLRDDEIHMESGLAEIHQWDVRSDGLVVSGRIGVGLPRHPVLYAMWERTDGSLQAAKDIQVSEHGFFRLAFESLGAAQIKHGRLLAVVGGE